MKVYRLQEIARELLNKIEELLPIWLPAGSWQGDDFRTGDTEGNAGQSLAISRNGKWLDFSAVEGTEGSYGQDLISLYAKINNLSQFDAAYRLSGDAKPRNNWTALPFCNHGVAPTVSHYKFGTPSDGWEYRDSSNRLVGYVCRFDIVVLGKPKKETLPLVWAQSDDGTTGWRWLSFQKPRPIYGAELLEQFPEASVVIVEGEKCAYALRALVTARDGDLSKILPIAWAGGGKAVKMTDWQILRGRPATLWPDSDWKAVSDKDPTLARKELQPGHQTMRKIASILQGYGCAVDIVPVTEGSIDGWDVHDAIFKDGWDLARVEEHLATAKPAADLPTMSPTTSTLKGGTTATGDPTTDGCPDQGEIGQEPYTENEKATISEGQYISNCSAFKPLGRHKDLNAFYYLSSSTGAITLLTAPAHKGQSLLAINPEHSWWYRRWPGSKEGVVNWEVASAALFAASPGFFDASKIRGRGCWVSSGNIVYNTGRAILDCSPDKHDIRLRDYCHPQFTYVGGSTLDTEYQPADDRRAGDLRSLLMIQAFQSPTSAALFGGWCALAPICGALHWRPHLYLSGPPGSGKSWLIDQVVAPILGNGKISAEGSTSEAYFRNSMGHDALPITFDDSDQATPSKQSLEKVLAVIGLARISSTDSQGQVGRSDATGGVSTTAMRSAFLISGVSMPIQATQDLQRFTALELEVVDVSQQINVSRRALAAGYYGHALGLNEADIAKGAGELRMRSIRNASTIASNARLMANEITSRCGTGRMGDQLGSLLAGWHSLHTIELLTPETAAAWLDLIGVDDYYQTATTHADESAEQDCKRTLLSSTYRVDPGYSQTATMTIAEIVKNSYDSHEPASCMFFKETMARIGLKIEEHSGKKWLWVANKTPELVKLFAGTDFAGGWKYHLARIPEATDKLRSGSPGVVSFGTGLKSRGIRFPFDIEDLEPTDDNQL